MMTVLRKLFKRDHRTMQDAVNEARLLDAERELRHLKARADKATREINARHARNHWSDSIAQMIKNGGHHA